MQLLNKIVPFPKKDLHFGVLILKDMRRLKRHVGFHFQIYDNNLVNNSIKFTNVGYVAVQCITDSQNLRIEVSDTGIGIEKDNLKKLFNPFYQVESNLTKMNKGSGLGLSISRKLVELLNGTITVKSEFGSGTTFTLTLPLKRKI